MKTGGISILNSDGTLETDGKSEVMQFTGLLDKNGREIYEGDIVKWNAGYEKLSKVVYDDQYASFQLEGDQREDRDYFYFSIGKDFLHPYNYEVIGNIYENSDLIN